MRKSKQRLRALNIFSILLMLFTLITPSFVGAQPSGKPYVSLHDTEQLQKEKLSNRLLEKYDEEDKVSVIVKFTEKADLKKATKLARDQAKKQKQSAYRQKLAQRSAVVSELKSTALHSQANVKEFLEAEEERGNVEKIRPFYIVNAISVTVTKEVAERLAKFSEVEKIVPNELRMLQSSEKSETLTRGTKEFSEEREEVNPKVQTASENNLQATEWNIDRVNAPDVWSLGFDGSGTIVANMDTGVQWDHPALKDKYLGYDPETGEVDHTYSFYDPAYGQEEAYDIDGHGTHVMGTMVGGEADGSNSIGVAPGAKWIAVQAFTEVPGGVGAYDADLLAGAQWLLAPGEDVTKTPDVVNNSWGGGPGIDEFFMEAVDAWREAGIVPVFAAGNVTLNNPGGPGSVASPANYPQSFAVGNTDRDDMIASGSLRGPSPYGDIKPEVSAPGTGIRSSLPGNSYGTASGTSMAAPHVAGIVALLKEAGTFSEDPEEQVEQIEQILMDTARERTDSEYPESPNNGYGHGIVDAFEAVSSVTDGLGTIEGTVTMEGEDTEPPTYEHTPPSGLVEGHDLFLRIFAQDNISVTSVEISYDDKVVEANRISGNHKAGEYEVVIPAEDISGDTFSYHWIINDIGGNEVVTDEYTIGVASPVFFEDFAEDPNWDIFVGGVSSSWEWGVPTSGPGSAKTGENVYATNLDGFYFSNEFSWLEMPPIFIPEGKAAVQIEHWYDIEPVFHGGFLVASNDPDGEYLVLDSFDGTSDGWETGVYDLSDFTGDDIYIAFVIETDMFASNDGWYIDNVSVFDVGLTQSTKEQTNATLTNSGIPLDATVSVLETGRSTNTNPADGSYNLLHNAGTFTVVAESYGFASEQQTVELGEEETVQANFILEPLTKGTLSGTITNERTGHPIEDATIFLLEDANVAPVTTDENGNYELTAYEGTYTLRVVAKDYHPMEVEVEIEGDQTLDLELEPFFTVPGGEIGYDDGTAENARAFYDAGNGWGVRMSLPEGVESALVTDGVFQFHDSDWPVPGGTDFAVEVWSAGDDNMPKERIAGPIEATAIRDLDEWTVVDLRDENIHVDGDFFMVYIQTDDNPNVPGLATDEDGPFAGRSYEYVGGAWDYADADNGNYMIRARIAIGVDEPVITSPTEGFMTNETEVTVEGLATMNTDVKLYNNDEEIAEMAVDEDGQFSFTVELSEGENVLRADSYVEGELATQSEPVTITLDTEAPEITIENPADGDFINTETVTVEGTVIDDHLDYVEVNGEVADLSGDQFSKRIMLDEGENEIEVFAYDKAGNVSSEKITVSVKFEGPTIENLEPSEDQHLNIGDTLKVSFNSEPGLDASFSILMPQGNNNVSENPVDLPLVEESEGYYVGYYTVTSNVSVSGGTVRVTATDAYGNTTYKESEGKLYINELAIIDRIKGESRFDTAIEISQEGWESADTVILARGDDFSDALAGVPLAYELDAPILLTRGSVIDEATLTEIQRLGATKVIILGGNLAISAETETTLQGYNLAVERLSGETRYDTAAEIARYLAPEGTDEIFVASGLEFPDALSAASHAAQLGLPIVLTKDEELPEATKQVIEELNVEETYIIGGTLAISEAVASELPGVTRLSGQTRYDTNIETMKHFGSNEEHMYVATGLEYADALTGAVLAAKHESSILFVKDQSVPETVANYIKDADLRKLTIFGGTLAVSEDVEEELLEYMLTR